jgi:DNA-3-methyladenine glycosylase I
MLQSPGAAVLPPVTRERVGTTGPPAEPETQQGRRPLPGCQRRLRPPNRDEGAVGAHDEGLVRHEDGTTRCWWCGDDPVYVRYHDEEWGVPTTDDRQLFEKLCLEGFQAGLSWLIILRKRTAFRRAFADFDPERVAAFDPGDVTRLLADPGIVRNRGKIEATIGNAQAYVDLVETEGSFAAYVWGFAPVDPPVPRSIADLRATSPEATAMARDLKRRGWRFVGPTTAYAFQQAMGLVNDHLVGCASRAHA